MQNSHVVGRVVMLVLVVVVMTALIALFSPRRRPQFLKAVMFLLGGLIGLYAVGRGIAEFWTVDSSNPASYQHDWGGPSLIGVFAVHSGPGLLVLIIAGIWLYRELSKRRGSNHTPYNQ